MELFFRSQSLDGIGAASCGLDAFLCLALTKPRARSPTGFRFEPHMLDDDASLHGLEHIVERERCRRRRAHRFHLYARGTRATSRSAYKNRSIRHVEVNLNARQRQRMTKRDHLAGLLGSLDTSDPRHGQHVSFGRPFAKQGQRRGSQENARACNRFPDRRGFVADVHDLGASMFVQVSQGHAPA